MFCRSCLFLFQVERKTRVAEDRDWLPRLEICGRCGDREPSETSVNLCQLRVDDIDRRKHQVNLSFDFNPEVLDCRRRASDGWSLEELEMKSGKKPFNVPRDGGPLTSCCADQLSAAAST